MCTSTGYNAAIVVACNGRRTDFALQGSKRSWGASTPDSAQSRHPGAVQLAAFAASKLVAAERTALRSHLAACPVCRAAVAALLLLVGILALLASRGRQPAEVETPEAKKASRGRQPSDGLPPRFTNKLGMEFVLVPKDKSWLGGGGGHPGDKEVNITHDFYLGQYEVTQEEWQKVTGINPSAFKAVAGVQPEDQKRFPVEQVSWDDAQEFIKLVNEQAKETGWLYRLPTEAEWEYACRGGPLSNRLQSCFDFYFEQPTNTLLTEQANFNKVLKRTRKVGSYQPNPLGLYDMHGNVWEWSADEQKEANGASGRMHRGGGWDTGSGHCRAAHRFAKPPSYRNTTLGLRLARVPVGSDSK